MADDIRIQQFRQMTEADPDNELGHFSLGQAYASAGQYDEAIGPLNRALEINQRMSKAYQILGEAYDRVGQHDRAIEVVTRGVATADELGDRAPRDAMADMLRQWGASVPVFKEHVAGPAAVEIKAGAKTVGFRCSRCGQPDGQLPEPPFKGPPSEKVYAQTCANCWREWIQMGTKVINELGLALSTSAGQAAYDQYMVEFLQLEEA